jgi:hypothetical protein
MMKKEIKQDINFLDNPMWIQRAQEKGSFVLKQGGFTLSTPKKPPTKLDALFLYYLLWVSQENGWSKEITVSHHEVLRGVGVDTGGKHRKRLKESLTRWASILLEFQGNFYDGLEYKNLVFHVIDSWEQKEEDSLLRVHFSEKWLTQIQNSSFFERLELKTISSLKSPLPTRLYEVLSKSFHGRTEWKIGAKKLAAKIPMNEKYVSHIVPKIESATRRIRERTDLYVELEVDKKERGKALLTFRKKTKPEFILDAKLNPETLGILSKVRKKEQSSKRLKGIVSRGLDEYGESYMIRQILYANEHAESNYSAFLEKAIKNDWGTEWTLALEKEEKAKVQQKEERKKEEKKQREQEKSQEQSSVFQTLAKQQWETMSEEAREELKREVLSKYPEYKDPESPFAKTGLKLQMLSTLAKRIEKAFQASS